MYLSCAQNIQYYTFSPQSKHKTTVVGYALLCNFVGGFVKILLFSQTVGEVQDSWLWTCYATMSLRFAKWFHDFP